MQTENRTVQRQNMEQEEALDLVAMLEDYLRCLKKYWLQLFVLLITAAAVVVAYYNWSYEPAYTAKITYSVTKTGDTATDAAIAKRISAAVPTVTSLDEFTQQLLRDVQEDSVNKSYWITSANTEGANLFTIYVSSNNYKNANLVLEYIDKTYPEWASRANGTVELAMIDKAEAVRTPSNPYSLQSAVLKGLLAGLAVCVLLATVYALTIKTVRKESDMNKVTMKSCLVGIPEVKVKKRAASTKNQLLLTNHRVDWGLKQAMVGLYAKIEKNMEKENKKVLLITSTLPQEGKTSVCVNLALAAASREKNVLIIEGDFRNPSVSKLMGIAEKEKGLMDYLDGQVSLEDITMTKDSVEVMGIGTNREAEAGAVSETEMEKLVSHLKEWYDLILIDTPPSHLFADAAVLAKHADSVVYVVRYDLAELRDIKDGIAPFIYSDKLMGYVINRNPGGFFSYGKYGYSKYGRYGHYGKYGKYRRYVELEEESMNTEDTL